MARVRSPNYPSISLPEAIERARAIYNKEHIHKADPVVIAKAIGYKGLNGISLAIISALKKYGLLEELGKELKISQSALTILVDPEDSSERVEAIRQAAFAPALFSALRDQYGEKIPSDENLRAFLLKRNFAQSAVDIPIRAYRETIEFVTRNSVLYNENSQNDDEVSMNNAAAAENITQPVPVPAMAITQFNAELSEIRVERPDIRRDVYSLGDGRNAILEWPTGMTVDDYEDFESWVQIQLRKIKRSLQN